MKCPLLESDFLANLYSYPGLILASMAIVVSSMDLAERPRNQRPTDPPTTTQKPETTTEDTSNRILSLPNEEKCMKSKFLTFCVLKSVHFKKTVAQSSFLSKVLSILLTLFWFQKKWQHFWKKWGLRNFLLKMNGL